jgi:predicted alpha/beta hydrolase family esterase
MGQVIVIHGATTFSNYENYLRYLRTKSINIDQLKHQPYWKECLQEDLGNRYEVLLPSMPNTTNARYSEWKLWFENLASVSTDGCILIGHSMGGVFLAKYLSENKFPSKVKGTILIAAPHSDESQDDLGDFKLDKAFEQFSSQAGKVTLFFGEDDPVIAAVEIEKYRQDLPGADFRIISAPDHFVRPAFPELLELIRSI